MNPNSDQSPATGKPKLNKKTGIIATIAILFALVAGAWALTAQKHDTAEKQLTDSAETTDTTTTQLPNGKTITYNSTATNKNIAWSSSKKGADYIDISYKAIGDFLASADQTTVTKLCGKDGELASKTDVVATISTNVRMIEYPTEASCLDTLATLRNTDASSRKKAAELATKVKTDVKQFYMTVIII